MHIKSEFNWSIAWFNMETSLNSVFIRSTLHYAYGFCVMKLRRSVKDNERKWNYDSSAILKSTTLQTSYNLFWLSSVEAYQLVLGAFHQADVLHGVCRASEGGSEGTTLPHSPPPRVFVDDRMVQCFTATTCTSELFLLCRLINILKFP
jgi:hypothetical protein